jgi:UDP-glucose 4-epimerase
MSERIAITGAAGYIGRQLAERLAQDFYVLALDVRTPEDAPLPIHRSDVRDPDLGRLLKAHDISHVVHLASVLESSGDEARDFDIDVNGTRNVLEACVAAGVRHVTVTSSGAAYGYHADNAEWIHEEHALRGNDEFPYARHKRMIEELLLQFRRHHPELKQLVLRPGTVLGAHTDNQITALFAKKRLLALRGSDSPFVFIWDQDLLAVLERGIRESRQGVFNLAGDGALPVDQLAEILGKPVLRLPVTLVKQLLRLGRLLRVGRYGPEQVNFLRYRPVLSNRRLKQEFGYIPEKTSEETFRYFVAAARAGGRL